MKKTIKRLFIIGIAVAILIPVFTYGDNTTSTFFISDKMEAEAGETVTMKLNLSEIQYDEFTFTLSSNENLEEVTSNAPTATGGNSLMISGKKSELSMENIALYYVVPDDAEVGSSITFTAKVVSKEMVTTLVSDEEDPENEIETEEEQTATQEESIVVTVIQATKSETKTETTVGSKAEAKEEKSENDEKEEKNEEDEKSNKEKSADKEEMEKEEGEKDSMDKDGMNKTGMDKEKMKKDEGEDDEKTQKSSMSGAQKSSTSTTAATETVTYNGESNNYLSSLTIDGYELIPSYSKTNNTYFLSVGSDVDSLNISAVAEDDEAQVTIYGNTNLQTGENKVLISVTAENGEVKTYRIYVTKN